MYSHVGTCSAMVLGKCWAGPAFLILLTELQNQEMETEFPR